MKLIKVTHEGWFVFCPCWFEEGFDYSDAISPIPKWKLWPVLEARLLVTQVLNWIMSALGRSELCGFSVWAKPLRNPILVRISQT